MRGTLRLGTTSDRMVRSASTSLGIISRSALARSRGNSVKRLQEWRHHLMLCFKPHGES